MSLRQILYVGEDHALYNDLMEAWGEFFEFHKEENGIGAIDYLSNCKALPNVVISELNLAGISGFQFHDALRNEKRCSDILYILLTNTINQDIKLKALEKGIDDIFIRPISYEDSLFRVNFLLDFQKSFKAKTEAKERKKFRIPLAKRIFDIAVASAILLLISPILIITALLIRLESKGPIYYVSKRVGTGYSVFDFYKLRSMYVDADARLKDLKHLNQYDQGTESSNTTNGYHCEECERLGRACSPLLYLDGKEICERLFSLHKRSSQSSAFLKIKDDPRITKVGQFIRKTSIDELPQLINVLKGDMSIVGNRPLPLYEAEQLTSDAWTERFNAPAGITGLWQVSKRGRAEMSEEERKSLDNQYARDHSFIKDLQLICKTVPALFQKENV
ncbi:sugar transferase [Fulvivirgaceae bacterium BMA10]|uniref:Sugar transferase n=1 Tax=Splendidivirga corallicola TaxID=3051826 RepID=A0ABT8KJH4_9BACT|nr:sugar transferase [Fulvivirgaceae bacterium BMA10]